MQGDHDITMPARVPGQRGRPPKSGKRKHDVAGTDLSNTWLSKDSRTPGRGIPQPLTSTAIKRRRTDLDSDHESETPQESEAGSEYEARA